MDEIYTILATKFGQINAGNKTWDGFIDIFAQKYSKFEKFFLTIGRRGKRKYLFDTERQPKPKRQTSSAIDSKIKELVSFKSQPRKGKSRTASRGVDILVWMYVFCLLKIHVVGEDAEGYKC